MKFLKIFLIFNIFIIFIITSAFAQQEISDSDNFVKFNPDGQKYEFVKNYLHSLSYFKLNAKRTQRQVVFYENDINDIKKTRALIDSLILDNANLRIAKNYLKHYKENPQNGLIVKASDLFISVCDEQIEFNNLERILLEKLYAYQLNKTDEKFNSSDFINAHLKLESERKESLKKLLEASMLISKILISNKNENGNFNFLGITEPERERLLFKLDEFYGEGFEGDLREGQTFLEASIVSIREILEDISWKSLD